MKLGRMFSTSMEEELKNNIRLLSEKTRIPQSKLAKEAFEDLFKKYGHSIEKVAKKEN